LTCPRCGRPVAVARQQCLYCGAEVAPRGTPDGTPAASSSVPPEARPDRALVIVGLDGVDDARLVVALGLSSYEAAQWARRGGFQLHRAMAPGEAEVERERIAAHGVPAFTCAEAAVRAAAEPEPVLGGAFDGAALRLRAPRATLVLSAADLLLVVKGAITREHPVKEDLRFARTATLEPGFRFHLHRRAHGRPVEIDPAAFDFGAARAAESSLLEISEWIAALARSVPVDDGFRRITPALAPVIPVPGAGSRPEDALRTSPTAPPAILDNLAQFRFYSAWRGAVERAARPR
jgi:hypothetical protein